MNSKMGCGAARPYRTHDGVGTRCRYNSSRGQIQDAPLPDGLDFSGRRWQRELVVSDKMDELRELLKSYGSCLVAYSGGVDSAFLALVARQVLGDKSLAAIADSPSLARRELEDALALSDRFEFSLRVVKTKEFENPDYTSNPVNRCYFCKHELFSHLEPIAKVEKFAVIAYGENASDVGDFRPGSQAASQFQVRAPLKEVGLTKDEIRAFSRELGLPTAEKPQLACLSSRIPHGEDVTPRKLQMIERAENFLRDLGFYDVRVRHHEMAQGSLARIEVGVDEVPRLAGSEDLSATVERLKSIGYCHVTLDLQGYRRGNLNGAMMGARASGQ